MFCKIFCNLVQLKNFKERKNHTLCSLCIYEAFNTLRYVFESAFYEPKKSLSSDVKLDQIRLDMCLFHLKLLVYIEEIIIFLHFQP